MNLEQAQAAARAALEKHHYKDVCSVIQYQDTKDPKTKLTSKQEVTVLENQPCKLSFETVKGAEGTDTATALSQIIKLFIAPEVKIPPGSKIVITHEGRTGEYSQSGIPAVYPTHQEIVLTVFERWA